jgi:hypothetical protein
MAARILTVFLAVFVGAAGLAGFELLEATLAADVYRERIAELATDYETLRSRYDAAVRRTAVTELVVDEGTLSVVIRTADGNLQVFDSPFDPSREIYVDYVMAGGRLWIRRVFDEATPPEQGMLIDPALADVDWAAETAHYGKATYRALGEGRWTVDVTGDGSLGLTRQEPGAEPVLSPPPEVRRYEPVEDEVGEMLGTIDAGEALRALLRKLDAWS